MTSPDSAAVPAVRHLAANPRGRDFVASDLHGCHGALVRALDAVRFDPATGDRLLLAGDLIDRGAQSLECLRLLREPWVYACLGNHEAMLLTWLGRRESDWHDAQEFTDNGGAWAEALLESATRRDLEEFAELATLVEQLPLVLMVDDTDMPFNVAHTDLFPLLRKLRAADGTPQSLQASLGRLGPLPCTRADAALWSRKLAYEADRCCAQCPPARLAGDHLMVSDTPYEAGLALTYVGHTPTPALRLHRSRLFIDRGAVYADAAGSSWRLALLEHGKVARAISSLFPRSRVELHADAQHRQELADKDWDLHTRPQACLDRGVPHVDLRGGFSA
ncbi:metallophosphoesterase [Azohydromonas lata]|uniref:Metallophosphoesterase n=1 Tax=Azohydromonas lata TaxID=45677 RepID=A0ABU5IBC6_9BURK|nr:metallophosphoesterase [Azohydromonas lata]MDZ5455268.1 metallophosphoesterase [Azohydromonas lata]